MHLSASDSPLLVEIPRRIEVAARRIGGKAEGGISFKVAVQLAAASFVVGLAAGAYGFYSLRKLLRRWAKDL